MNYKKYIHLGILVSALMVLLSSFRMMQLYQNDQLWLHWPLILFVGLWLTFALFHLRFKLNQSNALIYLSYSSIAAALLSLGFPPFLSTFTVFIGFVPLFFIERLIEKDEQVKHKTRASLAYGYLSFSLWNILTTYWVANTALVAGLFAIAANSFLMTIPWATFILFRKYVGNRTAYVTFVTFWLCFEYLHMNWDLTWPWLTLGNALSTHVWLPQWYTFTGALGGSFWILMANVYFFEALWKYRLGVLSNGRKLALALWIFVPTLISIGMYFTYQTKGEEREVVIVQPNFEPHYEKFSIPNYQQLDRFISLSEQGLSEQSRYLLFPETAFESINMEQLSASFEMQKMKGLLGSYPDLYWVSGISAYKIFPRFVPNRPNLRTSVRGDQTIYWEAYNAAIQTDFKLDDVQFYAKSKLVPGPEIFPFRDQLYFLKPLVDKLDGTIEGLATQPDRAVFQAGKFSVAPVICYESVFGEYCTEYVQNGANAIFIMTNDGWWDKTPGHLQHLYFGRLRAIENRRDIARSANSGISCFINQKGQIRQRTSYNEEAVISDKIQMNTELTFYTVWGDYIGRLAMFVSLFQVLYIIFGMLKKRLKIL